MPTSINNSEDQPESRNLKALTNIRLENRNRAIIGQLNITSIRNKFDFLCSEVNANLDLSLISETKPDDSFPTMQFLMSAFCKPYRLDRCSNGGGILLKSLHLKSFSKEPTCFKNPNNPSRIDLFLTNRSRYFQNTFTIETGISDFHKLVVTVLKYSMNSKNRKSFNTETIKLLTRNYLELNWTRN